MDDLLFATPDQTSASGHMVATVSSVFSERPLGPLKDTGKTRNCSVRAGRIPGPFCKESDMTYS